MRASIPASYEDVSGLCVGRDLCMGVYLKTSVCCRSDGFEERIVNWVCGDGECAVDYATIDMDTKVDFQHIVVLQDDFFRSSIRGPVCSYVIQTESSRKA